jgi:hypothetical protein
MDAEKKSLFVTSRAFDRAILSATTQVSTLPVTNLQTQQPARKYRATTTSYRVNIDLGVGRDLNCNCAVIIGHNGTATATAQIKGGDSQDEIDGTNPADVDSGIQSVWPAVGKPTEEDWPQYSSLVLFDNELNKRWWSLNWTDTANSSPSEAGRVMVGRAFRPKFNISGNPLVGLVTSGIQRRSAFNRIYTDARGPLSRRMDVPINTINERDMWDSLFEMQRLLGVTEDFFFSANPAEEDYFHKWSGQFLFEDLSRFQANMQFDDYGRIWSTSFGILELV